jgi:uncharacterized protein (DUF983 family)
MSEIRTQAGLIVAPDMLKHSIGDCSYEEQVRLHGELVKLMQQIEACEKTGIVIEHHPALDATGLCTILLLGTDVVMAYTMWKNGAFPEAPKKEAPKDEQPLIVTD